MIFASSMRTLIQEVESYRSAVEKNSQESHDGASKGEELKKYFSVTRRLIDYMEYHVIGNDSVLRRLKVA